MINVIDKKDAYLVYKKAIFQKAKIVFFKGDNQERITFLHYNKSDFPKSKTRINSWYYVGISKKGFLLYLIFKKIRQEIIMIDARDKKRRLFRL